MTTKISNIVNPEEFSQYIAENTMAGSPLSQAGILTRNPVIGEGLRGASDHFTVPFWLDLDGEDEFGIANDNPDDKLQTSGIAAKSLKVKKIFNTKGWSAMALASEIAGSNAMTRIQERVQAYIDRQAEKKLVAVLNGVYAANVADTGDMVNDVTAAATTTYQAASDIQVPDKCLNRKSLVDTISTLGMNQSDIVGIMVHRDIYNELVKLDQVKYLKASEQSMGLATYQGLALTYSEDLPKVGATGVYTSVLFGRGAIAADFTAPKGTPSTEVHWDPLAGNGSGEETLIIRQNSAFAPAGWSFLDATVAGISPTLAELADPDNYKREYERKNCPIAFLKHVSFEKATAAE